MLHVYTHNNNYFGSENVIPTKVSNLDTFYPKIVGWRHNSLFDLLWWSTGNINSVFHSTKKKNTTFQDVFSVDILLLNLNIIPKQKIYV